MGISAKESRQVLKVRKKLEHMIEEEKGKINKDSLKEMSHLIQQWIYRHQNERIRTEERPVKLFNENSNPAAPQSEYVKKRLQELRAEMGAASAPELKGRVKPSSTATPSQPSAKEDF